MLDTARKISLREIEEIVETACAGEDTIEIALVFDV